jgi:hypothetical protein
VVGRLAILIFPLVVLVLLIVVVVLVVEVVVLEIVLLIVVIILVVVQLVLVFSVVLVGLQLVVLFVVGGVVRVLFVEDAWALLRQHSTSVETCSREAVSLRRGDYSRGGEGVHRAKPPGALSFGP